MYELPVVKHAYDECGECDVCCLVMGVVEIGKPHFAKCEHANGKGCDIHDHKPETCAGWSCDWRKGYLGDRAELRPDKYGYMFSSESGNGTVFIYPAREHDLPPMDKVVWLAQRSQNRSNSKRIYFHPYGLAHTAEMYAALGAVPDYEKYGVQPKETTAKHDPVFGIWRHELAV